MNVHHLELFYYVARHRGIVAGCRHIPYGIQQPAVSSQIASLEDDLGVRLFHRRPFQLTPPGERLYAYVAPFFARLGDIELEVKGTMAQELRLIGPTQVMRDHLPEVIAEMRTMYPRLRLNLQEADQQRSEERIALGEADIAITVLEERANPGFRTETLARLPLVLLVPADSPFKTAQAAIRAGCTGDLPLIALPAHERICRIFKDGLRKRSLHWSVAMEVSSNDLITLYVLHGLGAGLTVHLPSAALPAGLRELPIKDMPALPIGVFWRGKLAPIGETLMQALRQRAGRLA